jgi:hypothetical protein
MILPLHEQGLAMMFNEPRIGYRVVAGSKEMKPANFGIVRWFFTIAVWIVVVMVAMGLSDIETPASLPAPYQ